MISRPITVPWMVPRPPARLAPPRTIAVTTVSSSPVAALGDAADSWESRISPDRATPRPLAIKATTTIFFTRTPTRRAATGLDPAA